MTSAQRKRLAREARKLAEEYMLGRKTEGWPYCAVGLILRRCGEMPPDHDGGWLDWVNRTKASVLPRVDAYNVADANDNEPAALPWALLSLADALEAA